MLNTFRDLSSANDDGRSFSWKFSLICSYINLSSLLTLSGIDIRLWHIEIVRCFSDLIVLKELGRDLRFIFLLNVSFSKFYSSPNLFVNYCSPEHSDRSKDVRFFMSQIFSNVELSSADFSIFILVSFISLGSSLMISEIFPQLDKFIEDKLNIFSMLNVLFSGYYLWYVSSLLFPE